MAEPVVDLEPTQLSVQPGGQAVASVRVTNPGSVVEGYDLDVVSEIPMPWATAEPSFLEVYPQQEATAVVTFAPPSREAQGGTFPFGLRVSSRLDPTRSTVAEGDLQIGAVAGLHAGLVPETSSGRWRGSHILEVSNHGNLPVLVRVSATDPEQELGFLVSPPLLQVPLGGQARARIKVRARHPFLRGPARRLPFKVVCDSDAAVPQAVAAAPIPATGMVATPERPVVDGAFKHKPILDRWVVVAAGLLLAAIIALVVLLWPDKEPAADDPPVVIDAPRGLAVTAPVPGAVLLTWDAAQGVDAYTVLQTKPTALEQDITALADPGNPGKFLVRLKVDTAEEYCYQLRAERDSAQSIPSSPPVCTVTTLPPDATPSPPPEAVTTLPPQGEETPAPLDGGSTDSPSPSPSPSPTPTPTETPAAPAYVSVLKFYLGSAAEPPALAVTERDALREAGVPAELSSTASLTLTPPVPSEGWILYVGAATEAELVGACDEILAAYPDRVQNLSCGLAPPRPAEFVPTAPSS